MVEAATGFTHLADSEDIDVLGRRNDELDDGGGLHR